MVKELPNISIVIIGYNEGKNLSATFSALREQNYPQNKIEYIYVDSGSIDNSIDQAKIFTNKVFIERTLPTAARNRNRGLIESEFELIHFIDGDIIIDKNYLQCAVRKLLGGEVQCVFGLLEEKNTKGIGRILIHDYSNRKPGFINSPGAGGTYLKKALIDVNGWDERIPRGEESEIGERLRKNGFKIWYLDNKMGDHHHGIQNLPQYLKRQAAEGKALGAILKTQSYSTFFHNSKRTVRNNIIQHILFILVLILMIYAKFFWVFIPLIFLYPTYIYCKYRFIKKIRNPDSIKFYLLMNITRSFVLYGIILFNLKFLFLSQKEKGRFHERMDIRSKYS